MRYSFDTIELKEKVSGICKKCGKRRTRVICEYQTKNPFNKNKAGLIKTYSEIAEEVKASLAKQVDKVKSIFICASCL